MLDFFCSLDGCSMSMSYNDWPSTMATRSSSACVALISIRFIVAFLASGYRAERHGVSPLDTARRPFAQARGGRLGFPALRHHGRPRERFNFLVLGVAGPEAAVSQAGAPHGTCSARLRVRQSAMAGNAGEPLTWPPRGRWSRTVPDSSEAGLLALSNFQRNQSLISPPECNRINRLMTAQDPTKPAGDKPSVRMITVPADRAGQRLDNFLLGQLKGAPRSLVYKLVRSGQVRVNGGRAKAERKLEAGDEVRIPPVRLSEEGDKAGPPEAFMRRLEQAIVFEDARLLALNKPTGVASHGGSGISFGATETLRALRPGQTLELVHRLDRDTSGLLIV